MCATELYRSTSDSGTQAPSEKHLEDWLWNNESEFNAQTCSDPAFEKRFVARQVSVPSGVIDLVGIDAQGVELYIVELKRGDIDAKALAQVLRYSRDISDLCFFVWADLADDPATRYTASCLLEPVEDIARKVLIGHSIKDENLLVACEATGISVYLYDYSDGAYSVRPVRTRGAKKDLDLIAAHRDTVMGSLMRGAMLKRGNHQKHMPRNFDAVAIANEYLSGGEA